MIEILTAILLIPAIAWFSALAAAIPMTIMQEIEERKQHRQKLRKLEYDIRAWESIALRHDTIEEPMERGYAIARMLNCIHQREEI